MCQLLPVIRLHGTHNRLLPRYISFLTSWLHSRLFISFINAICIRKVIAFTHLCMHHLNVCMQEGFRGWNLQCNPFCLLHHNLAVKDFVLCCGRTPVACCDNEGTDPFCSGDIQHSLLLFDLFNSKALLFLL